MTNLENLDSALELEVGLVTSRQLVDSGLRPPEIRRLVRIGRLHPVRYRYYTAMGPPTWRQQLGAAVARVGHAAVVSHRSAARLHGLCDQDDIELTIRYPADSHASGVVVHRSRDLEPEDVVLVDSIPATSLLRTVCDLGLVLPRAEVERHVDHCVALDLISTSDLARLRERVGEHGRTGVTMIDDALAWMPDVPTLSESGPELKLLKIIAGSALPTPTRQFALRACGHNYRLDLAYPDAKIALEYDGVDSHSTPEQLASDRRRQANIEAEAWRMLRYAWADLQPINQGRTLATIRRALRGLLT